MTQTITELLNQVREFRSSNQTKTDDIRTASKALREAGDKVALSWSGSFAGYHSELYFRNFQRPSGLRESFDPEWGGIHGVPDGWKARTEDEVKGRIEELAHASLKGIEDSTDSLLAGAKNLQREILIQLASVEATMTDADKNLLKKIEGLKWTSKKGGYIQANMPKTFMSRDSRAMAQGIRLPAHLYYDAVAYDCAEQCADIEEFLSDAERLLRQLDARSTTQVPSDGRQSALALVRTICARFHTVTTQLRHRHNDRATLTVTDEYDVQDLLYALLRLHFDDVRPEEWTPSYAGGASRMDFLLKEEKIVVEAKMTRTGLTDKQIADQLIIDAARYKAHADCKKLVCFVYDPESRVRNPRGVESDLEKLSSAELAVIAIIAP